MTGKDVKTIRSRLGLTQAELADLLGTTRNSVARWERNAMAIHPLRHDLLAKLLTRATRAKRDRK